MHPSSIIDCHTHAYSYEVVANPREWAESRGEYHWANLVAPKDRRTIQGWSNPESMIKAMDHARVDQAVLLGWYWENESTARWHNQIMAEWISLHPNRLHGFASIYPNDNVLSQLQSAKELGFCGVGEIHIGVQKFSVDDTAWRTMADWCIKHNWPVNFHVTEAAGLNIPETVATPLQNFVELAQSAPSLKMILAHWGGGLPFFEQNPKIQNSLKNVYYDTAASPLLYDIQIFQRMVDLLGPNKILFGSDYPLRVYPRKQKVPDMETFIQEIRIKSQLPECVLNDIFGGNFARLIGLPSEN